MIQSHESQAERNHGQSLERLADRGGLGCYEAICVLEDRGIDVREARTKRVEQWRELLQAKLDVAKQGCRRCWWQEGGLCYKAPVTRVGDGSGRSTKVADFRCDVFKDKKKSVLYRLCKGATAPS